MSAKLKLYCFYMVQTIIDVDAYVAVIADTIEEIDGKEYCLYAYTTEKKLAKKFRETRNMDMFIEKIHYVTNEYYDEFYSNHNEQCYDTYSIYTEKIINGKCKADLVKIDMTFAEHEQITVFRDDWLENLLTFDQFTAKFLRDIGFTGNMKRILNSVFFLDSYISEMVYPYENIIDEEIYVDELMLFITLFRNVLKRMDNEKIT